jgi:phosphate transport system substrate-binding protein
VTDAAWRERPVVRVGRDADSATHEMFVSTVLRGAREDAAVRQLPNGAAVVAAVTAEQAAIGYAGFASMAGTTIRALALAETAGKAPIAATRANIATRRYPLSRFLYLYVPAGTRSAGARELLKLACSSEGQSAAAGAGLLAMPLEFCRREIAPLLLGAQRR